MPIGILVNSVAILLGGLLGGILGNRLNEDFKDNLTMVLGVCSMGMGIYAIVPMKYMPPVIFALVIGTGVGLFLHLGEKISRGAELMQRPITKLVPSEHLTLSNEDFVQTLVTVIVLFCASGTGIYGSLDAGMTGDHSILLSKSILDFFTAAIFACNLGYVVSIIAIPQFILFYSLFLLANFIFPMTTPEMISDFKACGGFLMLATGFRMTKIKLFPIADIIPAMILVMPFSWAWAHWIVPFV